MKQSLHLSKDYMTPLVLVVGFLGSGKTTFLKNLMPALALEGITPGLLINDYQNARVDAAQFDDLIQEVRALSGDCVCCGSRDQLLEELQNFKHGPERIMVIETNGTTDATQLIESLALDPSLKKFTPPIQLSMVDGKRWQKRLWHNSLEREQTRTASHLSISHKDSISPERLAHVQKSLEECGARGIFTEPFAFAHELAAMAREGLSPIAAAPLEKSDHPHHHSHGHSVFHFASCEMELPRTVSKKSFVEIMARLPEEVIRAKGIVVFDENPDEFYVFQKTDSADATQFFPVGKAPRVNTPLVLLIGPNLPVEALEEMFDALSER